MADRNPTSQWNPAYPPDLSPSDYEVEVVAWLRQLGESLDRFDVQHLKHLQGSAGDYEFDGVAEFTILGGAKILIIVECKRYSSPVERDHLITLWGKKDDVSAHKAMMFATCGFQSGALDYARQKGIATITFVRGEFLYETRSRITTPDPPTWLNLPSYAGILMQKEAGNILCSTIDRDDVGPLQAWIRNNEHPA